jgi:hypothetical protein
MGSAARRQWAGRRRCAVEQRQGTRKVKEGVGEKSGPADARRKQVAQERREKMLGGLRRFRLGGIWNFLIF